MNQKIYLSEDWLFNENFQEGMTATEYPEETLQPVRIPHTCKETPFHYFDESLYQMVSGYRRHLHIPTEWQGKRILLTFEGAGHDSTVYLNGSKVGEHHCGYTAFTVDLSAYANYGQDNVLCVRLDSREDLNVPPFGYVIDYMTYGGIYRDVYLEVKDQIALEDIFVHTLITPDEAQVTSEITFYEVAKDLNVRQYYMLKSDAVMSGVVSDVTSDNGWQFLCEQNVVPFANVISTLVSPLFAAADSYAGLALIWFMIPLFWFMGIHGPSVVKPALNAALFGNITTNLATLQAGGHPALALTENFGNYIGELGGTGATFIVPIIFLLFMRSKQLKYNPYSTLTPASFIIFLRSNFILSSFSNLYFKIDVILFISAYLTSLCTL